MRIDMTKRGPNVGLHAAGKERPHVWKCGPDEYKHSMYTPWMKARAQAKFRGETWELSFEQFYELWRDEWPNRGRQPDNIVMTREDTEGKWNKKNTILMTRKEHLVRHGRMRKGEKRGPRNGKRN
jgi:hypothetical protein